VVKTASTARETKVHDEKAFVLQIEDLLENSRLIKRETLNLPEFIYSQRPEQFKDLLSGFYDQILTVYEEFSDFKIIKFQNEL
jgi:hypothetical protein